MLWMKKYTIVRKEKYVLIQLHFNNAVNPKCRVMESQFLMLANKHQPDRLLRLPKKKKIIDRLSYVITDKIIEELRVITVNHIY